MKAKARIAIASLTLLLTGCASPTPNLHRVDGKVWRSGQPDRQDFRELQRAGIREVLSLRRWSVDDELAPPLIGYRVPMEAHRLDDESMAKSLSILVRSQGPILVHCWHGSDRTGAVIALYRMVVQGWPRERAIAELESAPYGHHAETFPNIRRYLEQVDIERMRRRIERMPVIPPTQTRQIPGDLPVSRP